MLFIHGWGGIKKPPVRARQIAALMRLSRVDLHGHAATLNFAAVTREGEPADVAPLMITLPA
jgi:hypothetical protein